VLDRLNYASKGFDRLRDIQAYDDKRVHRLTHNFTLPLEDGVAYEIGQVEYILHLGAETHVEKSISDPRPFVYSNVIGTMEMLEFARKQDNLKAFVYFSTDEIFGPAAIPVPKAKVYTEGSYSWPHESYQEWDRYNSTNPYSATKAGGEELCLAWANTYKLPVIITHCMNVFGERQNAEKFIPNTIRKVLAGEKVLIHSNPDKTKAGSRFWIHARNVAAAVSFILEKGQLRDKYNIVGEMEVDNLAMAELIADHFYKSLDYEMLDFHSSRPGHDLRYALDGSKMEGMGWKLPVDFYDSLDKTMNWYASHPAWLKQERRQENGQIQFGNRN